MEIPRKPANAIEVFRIELPLRWGDMDAMGHLNNTMYFRFMEQARISWFEAMGFLPDSKGDGPVIINAGCTFIKQMEYPGTVLVRKFVGQIGTSSFDTYSLLSMNETPERVDAEGCGRVVWVNFPAQKSVPLPAEVRAKISKPHRSVLS
jgi:acyl-CoA thioester hydrolase